LFFIAAILGLAAGIIIWSLLSFVIGHSITLVETRRPELAGSMRMRVGEIAACSVAFVGSLVLGFWLAWLITERIK
jgi:hypothetical protein